MTAEKRYIVRDRPMIAGSLELIDTTVEADRTGRAPNVIARFHPSVGWFPTQGHKKREINAALALTQ